MSVLFAVWGFACIEFRYYLDCCVVCGDFVWTSIVVSRLNASRCVSMRAASLFGLLVVFVLLWRVSMCAVVRRCCCVSVIWYVLVRCFVFIVALRGGMRCGVMRGHCFLMFRCVDCLMFVLMCDILRAVCVFWFVMFVCCVCCVSSMLRARFVCA